METTYTFTQAVAAFMAARDINEQEARLAAWSAGPIKGDELAQWYDENHAQLSNTPNTVAAAKLWHGQ